MTSPAQGHYYRKQFECACGIIAWSHRARYRTALRLVGPDPGRLLDYGCGDGTFLAMAAGRLREGCGADIAADQLADCRLRLADLANLRFVEVRDLAGSEHDGTFDVVTCMETLEHCVDATVERVLDDLARLVTPQGRVVISVPVETGAAFLVKAVARRAAAWRGLSDYAHYERYPLRDAVRMVFAGSGTSVERPVYGAPDAPFHSHYGFNWRRLRARIDGRLNIERTVFSPLALTGSWAASQAWFICRRRPDPA